MLSTVWMGERGVKTNEVSLMRSLVQRQEKVVVTVGGGLETPPLVENTNFNLHKYILQLAHTFSHLAKCILQFGQKTFDNLDKYILQYRSVYPCIYASIELLYHLKSLELEGHEF